VNPITYPADLPITSRHDEILEAIQANQVVVIAGETGSGKSTQIPKMCLELGRGVDAWIGHTQPRRIAARAVAERVAEELGTTIGGRVGYAVRFNDRVGPGTSIKIMTDGLLLAEIQRDRQLRRYDTIIIDEAHERGLNIDFLLGYLHTLLPRRPDLKLIITSATIDTQRFADHYDGAAVIEVSGRGYPVEMRYRPLDGSGTAANSGIATDRAPRDQSTAIADAVEELVKEGDGDILVFCSGEREIRDAEEAITELRLANTEVFPLFARLSSAEQHRVFEPHSNRRVVIATNVAETSLTVPGVRYVVDPGTARISRYSHRTKVQRLPIEAVSQASANQRAGRCGRVAPGICVRLYTEEDLESRPEFTEPEIQRTNLASVILQMAALRIGDPAEFPFVDPPDLRAIRDGVALLEELDAVDPEHVNTRKWLTPLGRQLARLPIDPRLGRMVLEASDNGCVHEVMVITSGLSIQDPRERPTDKRDAADAMHKRFSNPQSDLLAYVALWDHIATERASRSGNQFRKMCRAEFLNYLRIREWQDIYSQLTREVRQLGIDINTVPAKADSVHISLLSGLLSHLGYLAPPKDKAKGGQGGRRQGRQAIAEYQASRGAKFALAKASGLSKKPPTWVMAAELVETNRMWARNVARIEPEWAERLADHLTKRSYSEPVWNPERGSAQTTERVTLYGLPIVAGRRVQLGSVDADLAREMFIHHALVEGDIAEEWRERNAFLGHNRAVAAHVDALGARARRTDIVADRQVIHGFYDERIGEAVTSQGHFDRWWREVRRTHPTLLEMAVLDLVDFDESTIDNEAFPESWHDGDHSFPLSYEFGDAASIAGGSATDGVVVTIPVAVLNQVDPSGFDWSVPGHRREIVTALVRSLPKPLRKHFVPVPDTVEHVLDLIKPGDGGLIEAVRRELGALAGVPVPAGDFDLDKVPSQLRPTLRVVDNEGGIIAEGKDIDAIRAEVHDTMLDVIAAVEADIEQRGARTWTFGTLARTIETNRAGHLVRAHPALVDDGDSVSLHLLASTSEQAASHWNGVRRLLRVQLPAPARQLNAVLDNEVKLALAVDDVQSKAGWYSDIIDCAIDSIVEAEGGPPWDESDFDALLATVKARFGGELSSTATAASRIITGLADVRRALADAQSGPSVADMGDQLHRLAYAGFLSAVGRSRLEDISRYLRAISHRVEKLPGRVTLDQRDLLVCRALEDDFARLAASSGATGEIEDIGWMLQELRVNLFAQPIGANGPISAKRVRRAIERAHGLR